MTDINRDEYFDALDLVREKYPDLTIPVLNNGFAKLIDVMPRLIPKGRTPEIAIVKSARVSYGKDISDIEKDNKLIKYLIRNNHTSPLESVELQFCIKVPRFVSAQFLRHRTISANEFSQRYAEIPEDSVAYWTPTEFRLQSTVNKQMGDRVVENEEIRNVVNETNEMLDRIVDNYHKLNRLGLAREISRYCLPMSTYSTLYIKVDLNNFLKMMKLRCDYSHAQKETSDVAVAMLELSRQLIPNVLEEMKWEY